MKSKNSTKANPTFQDDLPGKWSSWRWSWDWWGRHKWGKADNFNRSWVQQYHLGPLKIWRYKMPEK